MKPILILLALLTTASLGRAEDDIVLVGQTAPFFSGQATDRQVVSLEQCKGKVVLLNFFATWCPPCMTEMPLIEREIWAPLKQQGLVVLAVGREHTVGELAPFKQAKGFSFTIIADPKREIYGKYASGYIPRCYLIGKDGVVKFTSTGYSPEDFANLKKAIMTALKN